MVSFSVLGYRTLLQELIIERASRNLDKITFESINREIQRYSNENYQIEFISKLG